jgi:GAF domain-containing protein
LLNGRPIVVGEGVTGWVLANRQPFYNADPKLDLPPALVARDASYLTLAACPIIARGVELHGAVTLYAATLTKYEPKHQQLIEALVALLAQTLSAISQTTAPAVLPARASHRADSSDAQNESVFNLPLTNLTGVALESQLAH